MNLEPDPQTPAMLPDHDVERVQDHATPVTTGQGTLTASAAALCSELAREPWRFDFYQALRRLQCVFRDRPRIGRSVRASDDPVRLGQKATLKFPPTSIAGFRPGGAGGPDRLTTYFLGVFGPNGALPTHLTEYVLERQRDAGDVTFARFADVFHHRMLCLFFRAWADAQPTTSFDRPETDRFGTFVGSLFGQGTPEFRQRDAMPDLTKLHFAGLLAGRTRHPEGLVQILTSYFRVPVRLRQFVGHWMRLPTEYQCRIGLGSPTGCLGQSATIGSRVWDCQSRFGMTIGPLSLARYLQFLPDGTSLNKLIAIVRNAAGDDLAWDLQLVLKQAEVPPARLDGSTGLGRTSWLLSRPAISDADDFVFAPQDVS